MPTFIVNDETFTLDLSDTMYHLKQLIIKKFDLPCKYVDIEFLHDKPIRGYAKMNLEPGKFPRTMDNFPFSRYNISDKTLKCKYYNVDDYLPNLVNKSDVPVSVYKAPGMKTNIKEEVIIEKMYDLSSNTDFPSLS